MVVDTQYTKLSAWCLVQPSSPCPWPQGSWGSQHSFPDLSGSLGSPRLLGPSLAAAFLPLAPAGSGAWREAAG